MTLSIKSVRLARVHKARALPAIWLPLALSLLVAACGSTRDAGESGTYTQKVGRPYQINGVWYYPKREEGYEAVGIASWYGPGFDGRPTANGETFDMDAMTAAHTTLPLPSYVEVTNLDNGRRTVVRVNDRGPFVDGRLIDVSRAAAKELGFLNRGLARVRVRLVEPPDGVVLVASDQGKGGRATHSVASPATPASMRNATSRVETVRRMQPIEDASTDGRSAIRDGTRMPSASPQSAPRLLVQVGSFADRGNAEQLVDRLGADWPGFVEPVRMNDGRTLYRVRLGPFRSVNEASMARDAAVDFGLNDARILTNPI